MPSNLMFADASFPKIEEGEDPQVSIRKLENYLFLLLEQLRYTLQNLEPSNFNTSEFHSYVQTLTADQLKDGQEQIQEQLILQAETIIANELYADFGMIADLTVNKLRTDYKRAFKYLAGDTSPLDYLFIHDETISFITATTDGAQARQMEVDGRLFWWSDASKTQMTCRFQTGIPVMVYVYQELVKAEFRFSPVSVNGVETVMPVMVWGTGSGVDDNAKCYLYKAPDGMYLRYHKSDGSGVAALTLCDSGVVVGDASAGVRNIVEVSASQFDPEAPYPVGTVVAVLED